MLYVVHDMNFMLVYMSNNSKYELHFVFSINMWLSNYLSIEFYKMYYFVIPMCVNTYVYRGAII